MKVSSNQFPVPRVKSRLFLVGLQVTGYWLLAPVKALYACPTCNDLVGRGVDAFKTMKFGEGIAWSMIPLFGMPFLMAGALIFIIVRASKKNQESNNAL